MDEFITLLILVIFVFIVYLILNKFIYYCKSEKIKSNVDGNYYLVKNTPNKQQKADTLAILFLKINKLLDYLKSNNIKLDNQSIDYDKIKNILNKSEIIENITNSDTSYTINKGEKIIICLSNRKTDKIYDLNLLVYVLIHELSHIINSDYGHGDKFKSIFAQLVKYAVDIGIYDYENYKEKPKEYCGLNLNTSIIDRKSVV